MTKITVIGEAPKEEKKLKPIEFIGCIQVTGREIHAPRSNVYDFIEIEVIKVKDYDYDCICFCKSKTGQTIVYTANFNDGVAE